YLRRRAGMLKRGGFLRESILADVMNAIIRAIYLDGGFDAARSVVKQLFAEKLGSLSDADSLKDPKTRLQELLQGRGHEPPEYTIVDEFGAARIRRFVVECSAGRHCIPPQSGVYGLRQVHPQWCIRAARGRAPAKAPATGFSDP